MTIEQLICGLRDRGVRLEADGNWLRCRPRASLTTDDLAALRSNKPEVLAHLRAEQAAGSARVRCYACKTSRFWRSIYGNLICGTCHPPAAPQLVEEWVEINREEASQGDRLGLGKLTAKEKRERVSRLRRIAAAIRRSPDKRETSDADDLLEVPSLDGGSRWYLL